MFTAAFTGTQRGMTRQQARSVGRLLTDATVLHHGDCVGADAQAHALAQGLGIAVVLHPPTETRRRAFCGGAVKTYRPRPYLVRNHELVDAAERLVAAPSGPEVVRSGTWATVRYARKIGRPVVIVWPDGTIGV